MLILVSWRRERWKPLEAEEEDEEGRSMAPTRLPRCVRRASKAALCALPPPGRPFLWTGLWTLPPQLHHSTCAVLLFPRLVPRSPHSSLFYRDFVCPHGHIQRATFCFGEWGQPETLDSNGFATRRQGCIPALQVYIRNKRVQLLFLSVVVGFISA